MSEEGLPDRTRLTELALRVSDLDRAKAFYGDTVGLIPAGPAAVGDERRELLLGAPSDPFLRLVQDPEARRPVGATGLYHFAVLYPSRKALAHAVLRVLSLRWPLAGAADHLVSEAVYLSDPEGNGLELYRDRPEAEWPRVSGGLQMDTRPLDVEALLAEAGGPVDHTGSAGTTLGHVHLRVRDLPEAEHFYASVLGFEVTQRYGDSAGFLSAGGYHHHVAINTWASKGARPASSGDLGLGWFRVEVPEQEEWSALEARLRDAPWPYEREAEELRFRDPSGHWVIATHSR